MSKISRILVSLVIIIAVMLVIFTWRPSLIRENELSPASIAENQINEGKIEVILSIEGFGEPNNNFEAESGATVFDVLILADEQDPTFNLEFKTYSELGVLIEQLRDKKNGQDNKYWQYYVNGEQPMVAADKYVLKNNDQIEWRFSESQF